ncbi:MAG: translation initiation factor Sui1 [Gemmataceae bacterium]|nr:translation initiation factor Sui1 [Gemmataceae bacterium]
MAKTAHKVVLFLDTGSAERGRTAEAEFNAVAAKLGLPWVARGQVVAAPADPDAADLATAAVIIAVDRVILEPLLRERFPDRAGAIEYWDSPGGPDPKSAIAREVAGLVARLLGGRVVADDPRPVAAVKEPPRKVHTVRVGRETAGRRGKGVTTVFDLPLTEDGMKDLATTLKQKCGTGGTVKDGRIEIQGDHRDRIVAELEKMGYKVKRTGG